MIQWSGETWLSIYGALLMPKSRPSTAKVYRANRDVFLFLSFIHFILMAQHLPFRWVMLSAHPRLSCSSPKLSQNASSHLLCIISVSRGLADLSGGGPSWDVQIVTEVTWTGSLHMSFDFVLFFLLSALSPILQTCSVNMSDEVIYFSLTVLW